MGFHMKDRIGRKKYCYHETFCKKINYFSRIFWKTSAETIKQDKCALYMDARVRRTSVICTENTQVRSKNRILALKMLKIRKKRLVRSIFQPISGKIGLKYLTIHKY